MANILKDFPEIGDIVVLINGEKKFIRGSEATTAYIDTLDCIGVVYDVQGKLVRIVGGNNTTSKQWSCVADYEITAIPSASGDYAVTLNGVEQGNFTYTLSEGTIEEFATQLDAWLKAQASSSKAAKWEAYTSNGHSYLQMWNYNEYENTVTIASTTLVKLIGNEVASYTNSEGGRNAVKQFTTYNAMCYQRMLERAKTDTTANFNPTTRMNGTTQLFVTFPCSKTYYDGDLGDGLRENFATYEDYIRACMVVPNLDRGMMQFRDGQLMTSLLKDKTILKQGVETYAYPAAKYAYDFDSGVDGFGSGSWWLPSMYELSLLMKDITVGTTAAVDKVNEALAKKTGWSQINSQSNRWSSSRYYTSYAWYYISYGFTNSTYFSYSFTCSCVSAFKI